MLLFADVCTTHITELSPFSGNKETLFSYPHQTVDSIQSTAESQLAT